jgi:hypothetical protein
MFLSMPTDIDPGAYTPKIMTRARLQPLGWNSRVFPGIDPLVKNDKVRITSAT